MKTQIELKYPELFEDCFDFSIGKGWYPIVDALCYFIQRKNAAIKVLQVKEKFGSLRFYVNQAPGDIQAIISFSEVLSVRTCEECGSASTVYTKGWIKNYCVECAEEFGKDYVFKSDAED